MKIHKNDKVIVIAGKDKGKTGTVLEAYPRLMKVLVEGVNAQKRHIKQKKGAKQGDGIVTIFAPLDVSNVQLLDPKTNKGTKIRIQYNEKTGKRERVAKKSGTIIT
jgi:large subunit ribosomal protein L24